MRRQPLSSTIVGAIAGRACASDEPDGKKRQHRDRRLVGQRQWRTRFGHRLRLRHDAEDPDRPHDVLDVLLAQILEHEVQWVAHLVAHDAADADPAWLGQRFQTRRDVDAVAEDVLVLDHVAKVDPNAELYPLIDRGYCIALAHLPLHLDRAAHRVDDAGELDQYSVAGGLDYPAMVFGEQIAPATIATATARLGAKSTYHTRLT
jgi:hypothetical protein